MMNIHDIEWFRKKKLNEQLRIFFASMITVLMVLMLAVSSFSAIRSFYTKSEEQANAQLDFMDSTYHSWFTSVNDLIQSMEMEDLVQEFCMLKEKDGARYQKLYVELSEYLDNYQYVNSDVNFIVVINEEIDQYVFCGKQSKPATKFGQVYEEHYRNSQKAKEKGTLRVNYRRGYYNEAKNTITFYQPIYSVEELNRQIGVACVNMNDSILRNTQDSENIELCMTDLGGNLVFTTDSRRADSHEKVMDFGGKAEGMFRNEGKCYFFKRIPGWNFYVASIIPQQELYLSSIRAAVLIIAITVLLLWVSLAVMRRMVDKSYAPVERVLEAMDKVSQNQLDFRIETEDLGEDFEKLGVGFNGMMGDIQKLMAEVLEEQRQADQIRLNALQSQIQPHFLYNTLDCIRWQARMDGNQEISELVMALACYYRICLSRGKDVITLQEELEHIRYYILIQNKRYRDVIQYQALVEEMLLDIKIPKLTLQPLVENAIYHGIGIREGIRGTVRVEAERMQGKILLKVIDSGKGMSEEQIEEINASISNYDEEFGYGVRNVNRRIELTFGNEYGLYYRLNEDGGVTVEILLPETYGKEKDLIFGGKSHV